MVDFFEVLKEQFRTMKWLVVNKWDVAPADWFHTFPGEEEKLSALRDIYAKNGWPGDGFDKEKAARDVQRLNAESSSP